MAASGARVRTVPPLVFMATLAAGWLLDLAVPLALPISSVGRWSGVVLLVCGVALMAWAVATMRRAHTTVIPWKAVSHLVTSGPFRISRNPIYLGDVLAYLGATLLLGTWWPLVLLPFALVALHRLVIVREEEYLAARFGGDYAAYRSRVRRWL
jgi:protein-S-isoprenylcysteine O-methyltransferase Ste14